MSVNTDFDLIIVGGGPGGYNAAERAGHAGLKTLLIEKETLGGVCLNRGCIPTKTLLAVAKHYHIARDSKEFGVTSENVSIDWSQAYKRKVKTVRALVSGVKTKMKKNGVTVAEGEAKFTAGNTVEVNGEKYAASKIMIATGSRPFIPPIPGADSGKVLTSREILDLKEIPETLAVIGGGVIGMEFASMFAEVGSKVTVIEMLPEIVPSLDREVASLLRERLSKKIDFKLNTKVEKIEDNKILFSSSEGNGSIEADVILMSVGRRPSVENMGFEDIGLDFSPKGIVTDEKMRTNLPGVWAVGDCTGKSLLAHSAYRMGEVAVADMLGRNERMRYNAIPGVIYTNPEAAGAGITEQQAEAEGLDVIIEKLPMQYSGRYLAEYGQEKGFGKVIVDKKTRALLGVHLIGGTCSEIIWGASALIEMEMRVGDVREVIFPHPTVSEIIRETLWEVPAEYENY